MRTDFIKNIFQKRNAIISQELADFQSKLEEIFKIKSFSHSSLGNNVPLSTCFYALTEKAALYLDKGSYFELTASFGFKNLQQKIAYKEVGEPIRYFFYKKRWLERKGQEALLKTVRRRMVACLREEGLFLQAKALLSGLLSFRECFSFHPLAVGHDFIGFVVFGELKSPFRYKPSDSAIFSLLLHLVLSFLELRTIRISKALKEKSVYLVPLAKEWYIFQEEGLAEEEILRRVKEKVPEIYSFTQWEIFEYLLLTKPSILHDVASTQLIHKYYKDEPEVIENLEPSIRKTQEFLDNEMENKHYNRLDIFERFLQVVHHYTTLRKEGKTKKEASEEINKYSGTKYYPEAVEVMNEFVKKGIWL